MAAAIPPMSNETRSPDRTGRRKDGRSFFIKFSIGEQEVVDASSQGLVFKLGKIVEEREFSVKQTCSGVQIEAAHCFFRSSLVASSG